MAQSEIPAFGDWETTEDTPYTQKFDNARRIKKAGVSSRTNDPGRNPEPPPRSSPLQPSTYTPSDPRDRKPKNPPHARRPETDPSRPTGSALHRVPALRSNSNPMHQQQPDQRGYRSSESRPVRATTGNASAMQPTNPAKSKQSAGIQAPKGKASTEGHGPYTAPGRSRSKRSDQGYEAPKDEATVPPFGGWNDSDAASGENYTGIFDKVMKDRFSPNPSVRQKPSTSSHQEEHKVQQTCPCSIL